MNSITQDVKYKQSLLHYVEKYGVSRASRKYDRPRSYIYFWKKRYDGTPESLLPLSRRPHSHPKAHTKQEIKLIRDMHRRNPRLGLLEFWHRLRKRGYSRCYVSLYRTMRRLGIRQAAPAKKGRVVKPYEQMKHPGERIQIDVKVVPRSCIVTPGLRLFQYTAIDEYSRIRILGAYTEQSTYSSADFLRKVVKRFARMGIPVECVQTDNGSEFTNRFTSSHDKLSLFEETCKELSIHHKLIRPYTPRHNGKVERSHRQDQAHLYNTHSFYSLADFDGQLAAHQRRTNNSPMRPLHWLSPIEFLQAYRVQNV